MAIKPSNDLVELEKLHMKMCQAGKTTEVLDHTRNHASCVSQHVAELFRRQQVLEDAINRIVQNHPAAIVEYSAYVEMRDKFNPFERWPPQK